MAKLITDNPELLLYLDGKLHITILGGIKLTGLDRLKGTLKLTKTDNKQNARLTDLEFLSLSIQKRADLYNKRIYEQNTPSLQHRI